VAFCTAIIIQDLSNKYKESRVILFGSSLDRSRICNDIDIAVGGISPKVFLNTMEIYFLCFYQELVHRSKKAGLDFPPNIDTKEKTIIK
jgi:predicted nucleotidyltransferase